MEAVKRILVFAVAGATLAVAGAAQTGSEIKEIGFKALNAISGPGFELLIRNDGTVEYNGESSGLKQQGQRTSRISKEDFQKLVRKVQQIHFFNLENHYDDYPLDQREDISGKSPKPSGSAAATEATAEKTIITDLPSQIVTIVSSNRTKSVEDRMGAPKGLVELEELIIALTHASQWTGFVNDLPEIPYYDDFPLNKRVTYRALVEHYNHSTEQNAPVAGYILMFMKNSGIEFELKPAPHIDLQKFDGWIVDATGEIRKAKMAEPEFVLTEIHPVRKYLPLKARKK